MDWGLKGMLRHGLMMEGIDLNELKPSGCGGGDYSYKSRVESLMFTTGISVEDMKEGTVFQYLEKGKNVYGEDIKEGENVYGENLDEKKKKKEEAVASFAAFEKRWRDARPEYDPSKRVDLATTLMEAANENMKHNKIQDDASSSSSCD